MKVRVYVDGSYNKKNHTYGSGFVMFIGDLETPVEWKKGGDKNNIARMKQFGGEIIATMSALDYISKLKNVDEVDLYYDYNGIEMFTKPKEEGGWSAKNKLSKSYQDFMKIELSMTKVNFKKVKSHSGDRWNDRADQLAREATKLDE